jgi:acetyl/propionyl-CoA carboxylase alpha subunit/acetyl-CoA carboxylase carboxyltransferase component
MSNARLLIANRGEIALRVMRSATERGLETVAIHGPDDADSLHVARADSAVLIPSHGPAAYLDAAVIVAAARAQNCQFLHPGYGFLAEQGDFASAVEQAGITFVGPTPAQLHLFGDKVAARERAQACDVPVLEASSVLDSVAALEAFRSQPGCAGGVILKALAGGGGRGMRVVSAAADAASLWQQASAEAAASFNDGRVYAERYVANARHIEVQVLGDGTGAVVHLWERDCTVQRRHQKLIEIAPAPGLDPGVRERVLDAALRLASAVDYRGLGTFEFLLDADSDAFFFIEANARLQVEHTVTEEVLGLDLVALQLAVAEGRSLQELGLSTPPALRGYAMQLRINAETLDADGSTRAAGGTLTHYEPATGPGIRIDSAARAGFAVHPSFDSLLAKLIVQVPQDDFAALTRRAQRAASEFVIAGTATNLPLLRAVLEHPAFSDGAMNTAFIEQHAGELVAAAAALAQPAMMSATQSTTAMHIETPVGQTAVIAPMRGSILELDIEVGAQVQRGQQVAMLDAMKMHHEIYSPVSGVVTAVLAEVLAIADEDQPLLFIQADSDQQDALDTTAQIDLDAARTDLDEVVARHALGLDENRPASVAKRRRFGNRTARENVADLCDPDSFIEYGALANAAQRRRRSLEDLQANTPADGMVAGFGTVNADLFGAEAARCAVLAYDYTVLAGTQGQNNHKKKDRMFELATERESPVVFFTEGGGGRPGDVDTDDIYMAWLDIKTFATWPQMSGIAPRIAVNSGRCFAGNAVIFGCADITIATKNSNIGLAGPAMIEGGGLGNFTPEDIGPIDVQTANGVVDIAVEDEAEGTAVARQVLGCFQGRFESWTCQDQRRLRHLIPEDRLRVYDIRAVIEGIADDGSVIEFRREYGHGLITALIRVEGQAFGVIANNPRHLGGAIDGDGGEKGGRFLQLCDTFGVPILSLCDTPGFMVGPDSEKTAAVRRGSRLILASATLSVPLFTVILRKGYGLGAQAMAGGSFHQPFMTIAWPTAEMGPMGLEGAVELGFRKELEATPTKADRDALFTTLVDGMYEKGKAVSVASVFEIDAVIDPAETRSWLVRGYRACGPRKAPRRPYVDVW